MKTTNHLFKSAIVIAAATILFACNKEVNQPQNMLNAGNRTSAATQVNTSAITKTKTGTITGYTIGTQDDSTKVNP